MLVKQIEMVWPPGSPCEGRTIIWEKSSGPEGLEVSPEGIVSWDTFDVELGWYDASAHGYDDCGCEYELSGIIIVETCASCCCGNIPAYATVEIDYPSGPLGNTYILEATGGCFPAFELLDGERIFRLYIEADNPSGCRIIVQIYDPTYDPDPNHSTLWIEGAYEGECCEFLKLSWEKYQGYNPNTIDVRIVC